MARRAAPGEGRPYQRRSDGRWVVVVRDQEGRRRYLYASTLVGAVVKRDEAMERVRAGMSAKPARITVGAHLADWLEDRRGKVRPSTWVSYEGHVRIHLAPIAHTGLARLSAGDVRRLVRNREAEGCSPSTIAHTLVVLRMAIKQAVSDGLVPRNVATFVGAPRSPRRELEVYQDDEPAILLEAARTDPLGALWALLLGSALRLGEATGLRWSDVDLEAGELVVSKSLRPIDRRFRAKGSKRLQLVEPKTEESHQSVALPAFVVEALTEHRAAHPVSVSGLVFTSRRGGPLDPRNVSRAWDAFVASTGLRRIRIHDLRHTAISLALAGGASLDDARRMARHTTIQQTSDTYGHLVRVRQRDVASQLDRMVRRRSA